MNPEDDIPIPAEPVLTAEETVSQLRADFCRQYTERIRQLEADLVVKNKALRKISEFDGESIWSDDRDDAANLMLEIAHKALLGKYDYKE